MECDTFWMSQYLEHVFVTFSNHRVALWYYVQVNHNKPIYVTYLNLLGLPGWLL